MPYIDPITGAYVADSLDALPPGYNQPKANNEANVAQMRAALNNGWDDNTPLPQNSPTPATDPFSLIKHAYQNMPGASFVQGVTPALLSMPQFLASLGYGLGNQAVNPQTSNFDKDTTRAMQALQYTPPTQAGRDISEGIGKVAEATGPLPELWGLPPTRGFTSDDLRVAGRTATEDFRNFGSDYANAKNGVQREYPTAGSRAAQFTDVAGDMVRPMAEKAYDMYMNPESSVEVYGMRPGANLSGLATAGSPMYAVKPKGGNWPTNLGSNAPLKEQGMLGKHLSSVQYDDPIAVFNQQLEKHFPRGMDNRQLFHDWEDYLNQYLSEHSNDVTKSENDLKREAADKFAESYNAGTIGSADIEPGFEKKLYTASDIAKHLPVYNSWVMGPYQKYITNQMGTGMQTDPLLQAVNEGGMPLEEIFGQRPVSEFTAKQAQSMREQFPDALYGYSDTPEKQNALENTPIGKITATTQPGIDYENALDASLYPKGPYAFSEREGFPVSGKLPRNTLITDFITSPTEQTGFNQIRKQVFQDLLSGKLDPNKISNVTPATVTRQMIKDKLAEFKEAQLSKKGAADWIPKRAAEMPTDMAFDDGSKMTIITPEMANADEAMTARDLGQITIDLNQCVGAGCHATQDYPGHGPYLVPHTGKPPRGKVDYDKYNYLRRLKNGEIEIASFKDPKGVSQATIRLDLDKQRLSDYEKDKIVNQWIKDNAPDYRDEYNTDIESFGEKPAINLAMQKFPEIENVLKKAIYSGKKSIAEMKGKDNGDVKEEYIPQMVEWLNSHANELEDVRDLSHLLGVHDLTRLYDAVGKLIDKNQHWYSPTVEQFFDKVETENLLPRFFTGDDFALKATEMGVDLSAPPVDLNAAMTPEGKLTEAEEKRRQEAYETVSQELRNTFTDTYLRDAFNRRDNSALRQIVQELEERPTTYFLGSPSLGTRQAVINRLRNRGLYNPEEDLANAIQQMEPEPAQQFQPERLTQMERDVLQANIDDLLAGQNNIDPANMVEPYATDMRILMGDQNPEAQLPEQVHRDIIDSLINQDNHTGTIRYIIDTLQGPGHFVSMPELTAPQLENILNMVISWTERYPLNE